MVKKTQSIEGTNPICLPFHILAGSSHIENDNIKTFCMEKKKNKSI